VIEGAGPLHGMNVVLVVLLVEVLLVDVLLVLEVVVVVTLDTSTTRGLLLLGSFPGASDCICITTLNTVPEARTFELPTTDPTLIGVKPLLVNRMLVSQPAVAATPFTNTLNFSFDGPELSHMKNRKGSGSAPTIVVAGSRTPARNTLNTGLNADAGGRVVVAVVGGTVIGGWVVFGPEGCVTVGLGLSPFVAATTAPVVPATPAVTTAATATVDSPPPAANAAGSAGNTCTAAVGKYGATSLFLHSPSLATTSGRKVADWLVSIPRPVAST
jgi:hypothetical protein